ncbi:hypothetical protein DTO012A9_8986 [Penicillium roqueforti]|nr:hypothetical protein DTO039G3_8416 [Penicillium roqueforti]KAI3227872.1 hypothetical protein DTO012A9_8986 [Penicillium roqueforti]KAI3230446.1 hypothetical protein CBS147310_6139 [Penicillium roqueforti]
MNIDQLANGMKILTVNTELLISLINGDLVASPIGASTLRMSVRLTELPAYVTSPTFVFEDPKTFEVYLASTAPNATATKLRLAPLHRFIGRRFPEPSLRGLSGDGYCRLSRNKPTEVREFFMALPFPYPSMDGVFIDYVTHPEGLEFITLNSDWRAACRAIPAGHNVQEVIIDLTGAERLNSSYVSRLVQFVTTILALKAKASFSSRLRADEPYQWMQCVAGAMVSKVVPGSEARDDIRS